MPAFLTYWRIYLAAGILLVLGWAVLRYGAMREQQGVESGRQQATRDLEKGIRAKYAADLKLIEAQRDELAGERAVVTSERSAITRDRAQFEKAVRERMTILDNTYKQEINRASTLPDSSVRGALRSIVSDLAGPAEQPAK